MSKHTLCVAAAAYLVKGLWRVMSYFQSRHWEISDLYIGGVTYMPYVANCCLQPCCGHVLFWVIQIQQIWTWMTSFMVFDSEFIIEGEKIQRVYPNTEDYPERKKWGKTESTGTFFKGWLPLSVLPLIFIHYQTTNNPLFHEKVERENGKCYTHVFSCVLCVYMCLLCWWKVHNEAVMMMFLYLG